MDKDSQYKWTIEVDGFPADNVEEVGTLLELAHKWNIINGLVYLPDGKTIDGAMLEEPVYLSLRVGIAHFRLDPVEA